MGNNWNNHCHQAYVEREDHNCNCETWNSSYLSVQLISLECMTCEASTQRTHLTILAEVWRGFDSPGNMLIMIGGWCTAYHLCFPRTRPEGVENSLQRVWSFLFKFYLKHHKYEGISNLVVLGANKQEWRMQKGTEKPWNRKGHIPQAFVWLLLHLLFAYSPMQSFLLPLPQFFKQTRCASISICHYVLKSL